jgi:hypothetical protein
MKTLCFLWIAVLFFNPLYSQAIKNVFDIARTGTVADAKEVIKTNPRAFDALNEQGYSSLILACYSGNKEVAGWLIENGSDVNGKSNMGTPIMAAVVKGNNEIVKMLLEKKADVNLTDNNGTNALIYATMFKHYEIAILLVKANANPEFKDNNGNSALDYAILADDDKLIEILKTK